ncbi:rhomboid family intramembrane serine protease [Haloarcula litorea]|uniref:rhomboid family intramembrane serine protease n=1 Tax=Haloarcula litorea TaxID=3032579 RepID=UPI0023E8D64D|nr:rhomboid family intramembrane serine protease [Halomicroarcula sp. GDY20]
MSENPAFSALKLAHQQYLEADSTATYVLMTFVAAVFLVEVAMTAVIGLSSIQVFATGIFGVYPWIAWPFSPVLHRGILHFGASLVGLTVVGIPIESHWSRKRYIIFLVATGYVTVALGAAFMAIFSEKQLAFYGTSGVIYALAGYSLTHLPRRHDDLNLTEWFAVFIGAMALITVLIDPFTGPYFEPRWINGGHTSGLIIGAVYGWFARNSCGREIL